MSGRPNGREAARHVSRAEGDRICALVLQLVQTSLAVASEPPAHGLDHVGRTYVDPVAAPYVYGAAQ